MKTLFAAVALLVVTAGSAHAGAAPGFPGGQVPFPPSVPIAVPEPATLGLLAGGALLLGLVARRRNND